MSLPIIRPFFETICRLRSHEALLLFGKPGSITAEDEQDVRHFLESEYDNERLEYPFDPPGFDADAALWAARIVYHAGQFLLYRRHETGDIDTLLPAFPGAEHAAAILSADLCLRFLPALITQARAIDPEDALIPVATARLREWHYSGVGYLEPGAGLPDLSVVAQDPCLLQLYTDRVIGCKDKVLAGHPLLAGSISGSMGDLSAYYWKNLNNA